MFNIIPPLFVELRDNWAAFYQKDRLVVLPAKASDGNNMLPHPDIVKQALHAAGIRVAPALVILPRNKALVGMGYRPIKKRRELLACAYLEAESAASELDSEVYTAVAARSTPNYNHNSSHAGWISWCVYPKSLINEVDTWLNEIFIPIREIRISTFEHTQLKVDKVLVNEAHASLSIYPGGSWDLVWLSGREYGLPYSTNCTECNDFNKEELVQALVLLVIRHLADIDVYTLVDIDTNIPLRSQQLKLNLHLSSTPEVRLLIEQVIQSTKTVLAADEIDLNISLSEEPFNSQWPMITLQAYRSSFLPTTPVIKPVNSTGKYRLNFKTKFIIAIATTTLALSIFTLGISLYEKYTFHELAALQSQASQLQIDSHALAGIRAEAALSENNLYELKQFLAEQSLPVVILHELNSILGTDAIVQSLELTGTKIQATILANSAAQLMQRLAVNDRFYDISMIGDISVQLDNSAPKELMHFTAKYRNL